MKAKKNKNWGWWWGGGSTKKSGDIWKSNGGFGQYSPRWYLKLMDGTNKRFNTKKAAREYKINYW